MEGVELSDSQIQRMQFMQFQARFEELKKSSDQSVQKLLCLLQTSTVLLNLRITMDNKWDHESKFHKLNDLLSAMQTIDFQGVNSLEINIWTFNGSIPGALSLEILSKLQSLQNICSIKVNDYANAQRNPSSYLLFQSYQPQTKDQTFQYVSIAKGRTIKIQVSRAAKKILKEYSFSDSDKLEDTKALSDYDLFNNQVFELSQSYLDEGIEFFTNNVSNKNESLKLKITLFFTFHLASYFDELQILYPIFRLFNQQREQIKSIKFLAKTTLLKKDHQEEEITNLFTKLESIPIFTKFKLSLGQDALPFIIHHLKRIKGVSFSIFEKVDTILDQLISSVQVEMANSDSKYYQSLSELIVSIPNLNQLPRLLEFFQILPNLKSIQIIERNYRTYRLNDHKPLLLALSLVNRYRSIQFSNLLKYTKRNVLSILCPRNSEAIYNKQDVWLDLSASLLELKRPVNLCVQNSLSKTFTNSYKFGQEFIQKAIFYPTVLSCGDQIFNNINSPRIIFKEYVCQRRQIIAFYLLLSDYMHFNPQFILLDLYEFD